MVKNHGHLIDRNFVTSVLRNFVTSRLEAADDFENPAVVVKKLREGLVSIFGMFYSTPFNHLELLLETRASASKN